MSKIKKYIDTPGFFFFFFLNRQRAAVSPLLVNRLLFCRKLGGQRTNLDPGAPIPPTKIWISIKLQKLLALYASFLPRWLFELAFCSASSLSSLFALPALYASFFLTLTTTSQLFADKRLLAYLLVRQSVWLVTLCPLKLGSCLWFTCSLV